jgi:formate C-acetyltransferase
MERIEKLRSLAMQYKHERDEFLYLFYKKYSESKETSEYAKYAEAFEHAFTNLVPNITKGELIVGKFENNLTDTEKKEWQTVYKPIADARIRLAGGGQDSHMAIDYELLLSRGINGIISDIEKRLPVAKGEAQEFYLAAKRCLSSVIRYSENYAKLAESLAEKEIGESRNELLQIAKICKKVPAEPAESFHEAVQSVHFITHCLSQNPLRPWAQQFQLGHPDRYLYPYYKRDIERGDITKDGAQLLLDLLGIQINTRVPSGLSSGYMVGGKDEDGSLVHNELTDMLIQVIDEVRLVYPAVGLCYTEDTPDSLLKKACEMLSRGRSHPALFNDEVITRGLISYGVSDREAHNYIHSTCVEITPVAASNVWVACPYTNMVGLLISTMTDEYVNFDAHLSAILKKIDNDIEANFKVFCEARKQRATHSMNPLLSCFVNDCLSLGQDIERGGARYEWIMPSFVGMANLVDSLYAMKRVVYDDKKYTVRELKDILDKNFEGYESLRSYLLYDIPKYGNDNEEIDAYFGMFTEHIVSECEKHKIDGTSIRAVPSVFCWTMHEYFGRRTGATPDGRLAGFPLGDGSGPCQGREMNGPTASILSSTKWDHTELIGGVAVNMKFAKSSLGKSSIDVMSSLIKAYMKRGGFEMQINVVDREVLELARQDPDSYRDLVVRIGGYSDYFTRLSPEMQDEIILRTEHMI